LLQKWIRPLYYYILRLLRTTNGDHAVALGFAIGFFPCWFPTFGIGLPLSLVLARFVRGNIPAAILAASVGSVTWPALFYLNYKAGNVLTSAFTSPSFKLDDAISEPVPEPDYTDAASHIGKLSDIGTDFLTGSIVNSIVLTGVLYLLFRLLMKRYRAPLLNMMRRRQRRHQGQRRV
jgi:Uncharacterized protein conserved in bacteria